MPLISKTLPSKLENAIDSSVKTFNRIKGRALNHRLLKSLCQDYVSEHSVLLLNTEVHWLLNEKAFLRLCLKKNIHTLEDIFCFGGYFKIFT